MIAFQNVSKSYPLSNSQRRVLLRDVTLELPPGNIAVLGRNGAGKSTLLRMIAGIERPDRGVVRRDGSVSWPIGFRGNFHRELTGRENLRFVSRIYGHDSAYVTEFVRDFAELGEFLDRPVKTYSSGMGARLAFGLSMAIRFDTYLVDELMAVGDLRFQTKCSEAFNHLLETGRLIMVSHNTRTLDEYCSSAIVLHNGTIHSFPKLDDAIEMYQNLALQPMTF